MKIKINMGDTLYEPMSKNIGEVIKILDHPDGRLVTIRWKVEDHVAHETEHFYKKVQRCIKNGDMEHIPKNN
tara:strand:- start:91 stop:306 length:216 start_codon:yes stop_codon:yes gene_type:complete